MNKLTASLCLGAIVCLSTQAFSQTTVTLTPNADGYSQSGMPTTNFGTATTLLVRIDANNVLTRAGYFQFDLSGLPAGTITSAKLRVFGSHDSGGTGVSMKALPGTTTAQWSETALNYNNAFSLTGVDLNAPALAVTAMTPPPSKTYEWDVTSYINSRRSIGHATVALSPVAVNLYRATFNSRQATANKPQLVVVVGSAPPPPPPPPGSNWPMFGKDYNNSRASVDTGISTANISSLSVIQRTTDGGITGTPTIVDGVAYFADFSGFVKAMRVSDGVVLWRVQPQTTMLSPSPFVTADTVYVAGNNSWVYALNRSTGAQRWSRQIDTTPNSRISSSPIVVDNILMIGSGSYQVFIAATPLFRGRVVFLNATTGALLNYSTDMCPPSTCGGGISVWSTAAVDVATRTGYIGTGQAYVDPAGPTSDALVAFNIDTGAILWSYQFTPNDVYQVGGTLRFDYDVGAAPNLFEATIGGVTRQLVGVGDKGGRYAAFDRVTGERMWITTVGTGSAIGGVMHSPAVANGRIYVVDNGATVGSSRNDPVPATSIVSALDAATGTPVWTRSMTAGGFGGVSVANGLMYFTTWDGKLHVLDTNTGVEVKSVQVSPATGVYVPAPTDGFPNGSASGPVVYNGRVYVGYGWTWVLSINGGLATLATADNWTPACPSNYNPVAGVNSNFPTPTGNRSFSLNLPADTSTARPVWVPLTGSVESTNENLDARGGNRALTQNGYIVIGPVRACAGTVDGGGTNVNGGSCNTSGTGGWTWNPWNEGRVFGTAGDPWKTAEGPDSQFLESVVKCVATKFPVDQRRVFVGGISSGGTMTNRALTFNSDFWAGGMPISGEWYVTQDNGTAYPGTDEFAARGAAVAANPTKIFQGRVGPFPLNTSSSPMVVISVWGGPTDTWSCDGGATLCANYRPTTQAASNYYSSMSNVVHVACSTTDGHQWPTINRDAFNLWALTTLSSHPKGTDKAAFVLTPPPAGYTCQLGVYTDHY